MPKIKTRKTAAKRFKQTGTGKLVLHGHAHHNHLNSPQKPVQYAGADLADRALQGQEEGRPPDAAQRPAPLGSPPRLLRQRMTSPPGSLRLSLHLGGDKTG